MSTTTSTATTEALTKGQRQQIARHLAHVDAELSGLYEEATLAWMKHDPGETVGAMLESAGNAPRAVRIDDLRNRLQWATEQLQEDPLPEGMRRQVIPTLGYAAAELEGLRHEAILEWMRNDPGETVGAMLASARRSSSVLRIEDMLDRIQEVKHVLGKLEG
jgi:hypothetical protein